MPGSREPCLGGCSEGSSTLTKRTLTNRSPGMPLLLPSLSVVGGASDMAALAPRELELAGLSVAGRASAVTALAPPKLHAEGLSRQRLAVRMGTHARLSDLPPSWNDCC